MPNSKTTCGPLYKSGLEFFTGMNPELTLAFAAGFLSGQAEKVYLGACKAAMVRPSSDWKPNLLEIVKNVAERYGLHVFELQTSCGVEIWMFKNASHFDVLGDLAENSSEWHFVRGILCGVPLDCIDPLFHERPGYGQRCD